MLMSVGSCILRFGYARVRCESVCVKGKIKQQKWPVQMDGWMKVSLHNMSKIIKEPESHTCMYVYASGQSVRSAHSMRNVSEGMCIYITVVGKMPVAACARKCEPSACPSKRVEASQDVRGASESFDVNKSASLRSKTWLWCWSVWIQKKRGKRAQSSKKNTNILVWCWSEE